MHDGRVFSTNAWWLLDHAKATHRSEAIELLKAYVSELIALPEFQARACKKGALTIRDTLRGLQEAIMADIAPGRAYLEIVEHREFEISLRYNAGRRVRTWLGRVPGFTASAPFYEPLLDINGEGIESLIRLALKGALPKTFPWGETISARKQEHLVRMLEDALAERRASTPNYISGEEAALPQLP
jgi:hypothetical protein